MTALTSLICRLEEKVTWGKGRSSLLSPRGNLFHSQQ